jgi:NAD(P)-dependent dehydrogenase (short-subunit alcohol dehydrogenase family)
MTSPKTAVITGAGSGIGRQTAQSFLDNGYRVALVGRREDQLRETADGRDDVVILPCDVGRPESVVAAFEEVYSRWGYLNVLFNNAGIGSPSKLIDDTSVDTWLAMVNTNLTGSFLCAREAFRIMRNQRPQGGRIINNGSISAQTPRPGSVPYTTTKHAITGLTKSLSLDGRPFDICCSQIDIGNALTGMATPMTQGVPQADGSVRAEATMDVTLVADAVLQIANLPLQANIQFMTLMANRMPFVGRG